MSCYHLNLPWSWEECEDSSLCNKIIHHDAAVEWLNNVPREWANTFFPDYVIEEESISVMDYDGGLHNENGPALQIIPFTLDKDSGVVLLEGPGSVQWWINNERHREDGPAIVNDDGTYEWYMHNERHREDGPAVLKNDGQTVWYFYGTIHRADGPAVEHADGSKEWWLNGDRHREDGPAIVKADGTKQWFTNGKLLRTER